MPTQKKALFAAPPTRRNLGLHIAPLQITDVARRYRSGLAMNTCDICLLATDCKTAEHLRDREISRLQSRSSFQRRTCREFQAELSLLKRNLMGPACGLPTSSTKVSASDAASR